MVHRTYIEVRFRDLDKFGHVNNAVYLTYAEQARLLFADDILGKEVDWKSKGLIVAKVECSYLVPVLLHDKIIVETSCTKIGNKSMELEFKIIKQKDKEYVKAAEGKTILVGYDYETNQSIPIPQEWRKKIEKFQKS
ncbi:MAG: acyl-CoA thioesterase [Bacteroidetes bacterium]|nr:MAG: acyl-CoA thioesterase [Bacteroidota bacterium]